MKDFSGQVVSIAILAFTLLRVLRYESVFSCKRIYTVHSTQYILFHLYIFKLFYYLHVFEATWVFRCLKVVLFVVECEHCLVFLNIVAYKRTTNTKIMTFYFFCAYFWLTSIFNRKIPTVLCHILNQHNVNGSNKIF